MKALLRLLAVFPVLALLLAIPGPAAAEYSDIPPPLARGGPVNDLGDVLSAESERRLAAMIRERQAAGQPIALITIPSSHAFGESLYLPTLARRVLVARGVEKGRSVVLIHDVEGRALALGLGDGFTEAERAEALAFLRRQYGPKIRSGMAEAVHLESFPALLDLLPAKGAAGMKTAGVKEESRENAQKAAAKKPAKMGGKPRSRAAARAGTSGRGSETPGTVLHAPPEPVDEHKPPLIPWSWVFLTGIIGYAGIRLLEWRRKRRVLALIYDSGGVSLRGGAESPSGAAWSRGLPAERRAAARSIPLPGRGPERCGDPCPRCGGPVFREMVEPAPLYGPKHIRAGCGRCTWFTETVTRRPRLAKAESRPPESRPPMADLR